MKIARGEYIIFVDSDDHIEPDSLGNFHLTLNRSGNPDLMLTRTKKIFAGRMVFADENLPFEQVKDGSKEDVINMMFIAFSKVMGFKIGLYVVSLIN